MITRIYSNIDKLLKTNPVLIIYGPRQVGKTTLLTKYLETTKYKYRFDKGDYITVQEVLSSKNKSMITDFIGDNDLIVIDEAQMIKDIGQNLKIIADDFPNTKVIVSGSASIALADRIEEPLTGRKTTVTLYPFSQLELLKFQFNNNKFDLKESLDSFLIFGAYPKIYLSKTKEEKIRELNELVSGYLIKDVLEIEGIRASNVVFNLLRLLAFQVGSEVSFRELGEKLNIDSRTIAKYMDLLEKAFVIFHLGGFSTNLRNNVTNKNKYYFIDNGIRNAVISQYNNLNMRDDIGKLWENFIISERMKKRAYTNDYAIPYFWRNYSQQEIDLIEQKDGHLFAYEFKWSSTKTQRIPSQWKKEYPESEFKIINKDNYLDFVI